MKLSKGKRKKSVKALLTKATIIGFSEDSETADELLYEGDQVCGKVLGLTKSSFSKKKKDESAQYVVRMKVTDCEVDDASIKKGSVIGFFAPTALSNQIEDEGVEVGDSFGFEYLGKVKGKGKGKYHSFEFIADGDEDEDDEDVDIDEDDEDEDDEDEDEEEYEKPKRKRKAKGKKEKKSKSKRKSKRKSKDEDEDDEDDDDDMFDGVDD